MNHRLVSNLLPSSLASSLLGLQVCAGFPGFNCIFEEYGFLGWQVVNSFQPLKDTFLIIKDSSLS